MQEHSTIWVSRTLETAAQTPEPQESEPIQSNYSDNRHVLVLISTMSRDRSTQLQSRAPPG